MMPKASNVQKRISATSNPTTAGEASGATSTPAFPAPTRAIGNWISAIIRYIASDTCPLLLPAYSPRSSHRICAVKNRELITVSHSPRPSFKFRGSIPERIATPTITEIQQVASSTEGIRLCRSATQIGMITQ